MNDVWVASRKVDGCSHREQQGVYASRQLAKEHIELLEGPVAWEDDDSISFDEDGQFAIARTRVLNASHLQADRDWRAKMAATLD